MRHINPQSTQITSIFGTGYIQEQHADTTTHTNLPIEHGAIAVAAVWSVVFMMAIVKFTAAKIGAASVVVAGLQ